MQVNAGKLQLLTVAAMIVLVSGGIAAYAQSQSFQPTNSSSATAQVALAPDTTNSTSSTTSTSSTSTSTTTSTTSSTTTTPGPLCQPATTNEVGRLVLPITAVGATSPGSISFPFGNKGCYASITSVGGIFNVEVLLRYAKPVTQYNVVLVANSTGYTLGSMVTGPDGSGQMQNQVLLKPGTYTVSLQILDTSSNPGQSTLVLQTGQGTIVSPPFPTNTSSAQQPNHSGESGNGDHDK